MSVTEATRLGYGLNEGTYLLDWSGRRRYVISLKTGRWIDNHNDLIAHRLGIQVSTHVFLTAVEMLEVVDLSLCWLGIG